MVEAEKGEMVPQSGTTDPSASCALRYQAIFESAVDFALIASDRDGRVTDWNPGAERILGWTAEEMQGELAARFFTPEDQAEGRPEMEMSRALETGRASDERWHLRKDGTRFWARGSCSIAPSRRATARRPGRRCVKARHGSAARSIRRRRASLTCRSIHAGCGSTSVCPRCLVIPKSNSWAGPFRILRIPTMSGKTSRTSAACWPETSTPTVWRSATSARTAPPSGSI